MQERSSMSSRTNARTSEGISSEKSRKIDPLLAALDDEEWRRKLMREMGSRGGRKGGKARADALSPDQRQQIAKKAAEARWKRK